MLMTLFLICSKNKKCVVKSPTQSDVLEGMKSLVDIGKSSRRFSRIIFVGFFKFLWRLHVVIEARSPAEVNARYSETAIPLDDFVA